VPKCPECKADIDSLSYEESGLMVYEKGEWVKDDNADIRTTCPECGAHITPEEAEAGMTLSQALDKIQIKPS